MKKTIVLSVLIAISASVFSQDKCAGSQVIADNKLSLTSLWYNGPTMDWNEDEEACSLSNVVSTVWATGNERSMAAHNGKIYISSCASGDGATPKVHVFNAQTGAFEKTLTITGVLATGGGIFKVYQIRFDSSGNMLLGAGVDINTGATHVNYNIYKTTITEDEIQCTVFASVKPLVPAGAANGRVVGMCIYGDIASGSGYFVLAAQSAAYAFIYSFTDGVVDTNYATILVSGTGNSVTPYVIDENRFLLSGRNSQLRLCTKDQAGSWTATNLTNAKVNPVSGLYDMAGAGYFKSKEREYVLFGADQWGQMQILDITDNVATAPIVITNKVYAYTVAGQVIGYAGGNANSIFLSAYDVEYMQDGSVNIYQFLSGTYVAGYKFESSYPVSVKNTEVSSFQVFTANNQININGQAGATVSVFDFSGRMLINQVMSSVSASYAMNQGMYIVKVDGQTFKVAVK